MKRLDKTTAFLLAVAALWAVALIGSADRTLVRENGMKVLLPVGFPLLAVATVTIALRVRRGRGLTGPGTLAVGATVAVGVLCAAGMLTIGPFLVPVAVLLTVACARSSATTPVPPTWDRIDA